MVRTNAFGLQNAWPVCLHGQKDGNARSQSQIMEVIEAELDEYRLLHRQSLCLGQGGLVRTPRYGDILSGNNKRRKYETDQKNDENAPKPM